MKKLFETQRQLVALLRLAVSGESFCAFDNINWEGVMELAWLHAVSGVAYAGVEKWAEIPEKERKGSGPEITILKKFISRSVKLERKQKLHEAVLAEFARVMEAEKIPYVVFKGLAVASMYPDRVTRAPGDVDFYVPPTDFNRAVEVIELSLNIAVERDEVDKHYEFDYMGIRFEMHFQMETFGYVKHQQYFSELVDSYMVNNGGSKFCIENSDGEQVDIPMLSPEIDIILVFKHLFNHLLGEGVGLRQLTDIPVLISAYKCKIDIEELRRHLKNIGYLNGFNAIIALCERYYGVTWNEYHPLLHGSDYKRADKILVTILNSGNFGYIERDNRTGLSKRIHTTYVFFRNTLRFFSCAPKDIMYLIPKRIAISRKAHSGRSLQ